MTEVSLNRHRGSETPYVDQYTGIQFKNACFEQISDPTNLSYTNHV